jgi:hypothetical protein
MISPEQKISYTIPARRGGRATPKRDGHTHFPDCFVKLFRDRTGPEHVFEKMEVHRDLGKDAVGQKK